MDETDSKAWDDLVAACEARGLSPWRAGMLASGPVYFRAGTKPFSGTIAVSNGKPCIIVRRSLSKRTVEAVFFAEGPGHAPTRPDPDDAATLGVLLGRAREVWGDPLAEVAPPILDRVTGEFVVNTWEVAAWSGQSHVSFHGSTEFAALCRAIVAGMEAQG